MAEAQEYSIDVLVVGSGGGGMTAALIAADMGASATVIEKGATYGGSTAMSGGAIWIPNNHLMSNAGLKDSAEESLAYLKSITAGIVSEERLRAYVDAGAEMVAYLESNSHARFQIVPGYSDYYPHLDGSKAEGGRTIEPVPFNARRLGVNRRQMRPLHPQARLFGRMMATAYDAHLMMDTSFKGRMKTAAIFASYFINPARFLSAIDTRLTLGNATIGRLRLSLADRNVSLWLNVAAKHLIIDGGCVTGVEAEKDGISIRIKANKCVILAAGGFARNLSMREKYQRVPITDRWTVACPDNTGDAIRMGIDAGAALDLMDDAWWMPTTLVPDEDMAQMIIVERSLPGSIIVNAKGRRFTNEAGPYIDVTNDQYRNHAETGCAIPAYMIVDGRYRKKYPLSPMLPFITPKRYIENGYLKMADTIEELAAKCGIDQQGLRQEVDACNRCASGGCDEAFHRGDTSIDTYYGDPAVRPNPCFGPIDAPPYYAVEIWPGDLGTKGGMVTDEHARVLRPDGSAIDGLYATGNCAASVMGRSYGGAGATIGPSMVFGWIAARHAIGTSE
ncbi:MAG: FAD-dependent oxidoreductase [Chloroflexota bacterium]|nr:FAD-dependent oxidoreductase [Chloroflexota bacterium]